MYGKYEKYIGKDKELRRGEAEEETALEAKRFMLSANPDVKERLTKLQEIFYAVQEKYPEIISLGIFGSLTKGYATKESDIDAYLMVNAYGPSDEKRLKEIFDYLGLPVPPPKNDPDFGDRVRNAAGMFYTSRINEPLRETLNLQPEQLYNISARFFRKEDVKEWAATGYHEMLMPFFLLSLGDQVYIYREVIIDQLSSMGKRGEEIWRELLDELITFENKGFSSQLKKKRQGLYPQTLEEARRYFLP